MLHNVVYGILAVVTWSAFFYKAKDLVKDWRNPELRLLSLAIATFATPFVLAAPWLYVRLDALFGYPNLMTLPVYLSVATCLSSFLALLVSWSSAQSKIRIRHRLIVGYAVTSVIAMVVLFLMGDVSDAEHPVDFDAYYAHTPYISEFLLVYALLFAVSMSALMRLCWRYSKSLDKPWLRRGLRVVAVGAASVLATQCRRWSPYAGTPTSPTLSTAMWPRCRPASPQACSPSGSQCRPGVLGLTEHATSKPMPVLTAPSTRCGARLHMRSRRLC